MWFQIVFSAQNERFLKKFVFSKEMLAEESYVPSEKWCILNLFTCVRRVCTVNDLNCGFVDQKHFPFQRHTSIFFLIQVAQIHTVLGIVTVYTEICCED